MSKRKIDFAQYMRVPEGAIAKYESHTGVAWLPAEHGDWKRGAHYLLKQEGLEMPTPAVFMPYVKHVIAAHKAGETLCDGLGNLLGSREREDLYLHLTTSHINGGAWSLLNARFFSH